MKAILLSEVLWKQRRVYSQQDFLHIHGRNRKINTEIAGRWGFFKPSNTFNASLPGQTREISFHLEAALHQNPGLGTSYHCHNLERFLLQPSVPFHRHSVGKGSYSGEKLAGQGFLRTENGLKRNFVRWQICNNIVVFFLISGSNTHNYHFLSVPTQQLCPDLAPYSIPSFPLYLSPNPEFTLF